MTLEQAIDRYTNNAEYERIHGSLQGCLEFRQLVEWLTDYKRLLEQEPSDTVSRGAFEQVMWERDVAINQLKELGYGLGENVEPCDDAVSRVAVCEIISDIRDCISVEGYCAIIERLKKLPPVTQKYGKWIVHEKPHGIRYLECPYCNTWYLNEHLIRNSYCPNCGSYNGGNDNGNE